MKTLGTIPRHLPLLSLLVVLFGCSDSSVAAAPNSPPQIILTAPAFEEGDPPIEVEEDLGLAVTVQVDDAEDRSDLLTIHWGAVRTDVEGVEQDLGSIQPDSTGWATKQVAGLGGGHWHIWARVEDSDGATDEVGLSIFVTPANSPPLASEALLGPEPAYETTQLTCEGIGWHDVDGDVAGWMAAWFVDGEAVLGQIGLSLDGASFDKDQQVLCELTPFDGELVGEPVQSNVVTILNSPPEPPTLEIDPEPVAELDEEIVCEVDDEATDVDGDVIVVPDDYLVQWYMNGVLIPDLDNLWEVPAERTSLGENWTCEVSATDGSEWSVPVQVSTAVLPADGDLVITEIMAAPGQVADVAGEWFELYNASGLTISLLGFELFDGLADTHVITMDIQISPGERAVLARNGDFATNGAIHVDYEYSGLVLDNTADVLGMRFEGVEVDRVEYDLSPYGGSITGRSLGLDPSLGVPSATLNDDVGNWCLAGNPVSGLQGDFASPGVGNGPCDCFESDDDGDGWGDHFTCAEPDCDDAEPLSFPGNVEICDAIDNDCLSGVDDGFDVDGDGVTLCGPDGLSGTSDDDCDDAEALSYPGNAEVCDGIDNDCLGGVDDGYDSDGDGVYTCGPDLIPGTLDDDCDDSPTTGGNTWPGNPEVCDGVDNDCVGGVDDGFDSDGDGVTLCGPDGVYGNTDDDCDDNPATGGNNWPGNPEVCDGVDNDCDLAIDNGLTFVSWYLDNDNDQVGNSSTLLLSCSGSPGSGYVTVSGDCDDGNPLRSPNLSEICDGIDNDCDFLVDDGFDLDGDGVTTCGPDNNPGTSFDNDCNDTPGIGASAYPNHPEVCDGIDNDCDGTNNEAGAAGCQGYYTDADGDTWGVGSSQCLCVPSGNRTATRSGDCYDNNGNARPGQGGWFGGHRGDGNFDYNCDNQQTRRWTQGASSCSLTLSGCAGTEGWGSVPNCGDPGSWKTNCGWRCQLFGSCPGCTWKNSSGRTQQCR
jgi:hypothetical protein